MTTASAAWKHLERRVRWPEQRSYEVIRSVLLYADSAEARARETGEAVRTIYRHFQRFTTAGFAGPAALQYLLPLDQVG